MSSDVIHIASIACGDKNRARVLLPMINSAILMSHSTLNFHLIADEEPKLEIENIVYIYALFKHVKQEYLDYSN